MMPRPPVVVQRQVWLDLAVTAWTLRDRMTKAEAREAADVLQAGEAALGWNEIAAVTALGRRVAERKSVIRR